MTKRNTNSLLGSTINRITIMSKKPKLGRPKLPKGETKEVFSLRLTSQERESIEQAASKAGQKPTEWARNVMLNAV